MLLEVTYASDLAALRPARKTATVNSRCAGHVADNRFCRRPCWPSCRTVVVCIPAQKSQLPAAAVQANFVVLGWPRPNVLFCAGSVADSRFCRQRGGPPDALWPCAGQRRNQHMQTAAAQASFVVSRAGRVADSRFRRRFPGPPGALWSCASLRHTSNSNCRRQLHMPALAFCADRVGNHRFCWQLAGPPVVWWTSARQLNNGICKQQLHRRTLLFSLAVAQQLVAPTVAHYLALVTLPPPG